MWKKILISSIFVLILSTPQISFSQTTLEIYHGYWENGLKGKNECFTLKNSFVSGSTYNFYYSVKGFYESQAAALAARNANGGTTYTFSTATVATNHGSPPYSLGYYGIYRQIHVTGEKTRRYAEAFLYSDNPLCWGDFNAIHLPFDGSNFIFRLTSSCKDSQGNITAESYEFRDLDTGEQKFSTYGDLSTCDEIEIYANSPWYTDALFDVDETEEFVTGSPSDILNSITQDYAQDIETLTGGDDDGVDDSGLLQNIATNTKINASNQQIISEQLTAQGNYQIKLGNEQKVLLAAIASATGGTGTRLDITNSLLGQIRDGIGEGGGGGGDGASAVEIGEAVGDELIESTEFTGQTGNEFDGILAEINAFRAELGIPESDDEYFPEGGINDEEDFKQAVQDMLIDKTDTTWFQALRNLMMMDRITAAGSCSASVALWGGSIDLSVCGLQGALNVFGTVLLGFATITAFMVALRG